MRAALAALAAGGVHGLAHITGGGLTENLPRVLPEGLGAEVDLAAWTPPPVFGWLAGQAGIAESEMLKTFNCGIGLVAVAAPDRADAMAGVLAEAGETARVIGRVVPGAGVRYTPILVTRRRTAILISGGGSNMLALARDMADPDSPGRTLPRPREPPRRRRSRARRASSASPRPASITGPSPATAPPSRRHSPSPSTPTAPRLVCLAGFMRVLTPAFIARWRGRMLNIHPSILPLFPGLHTHARALAAGMAVHGCTVHEVTPELDSGPILGQAVVPVEPGDSPETLAARLLPMEHRLYPAVLRRFASGDRSPVAILG